MFVKLKKSFLLLVILSFLAGFCACNSVIPAGDAANPDNIPAETEEKTPEEQNGTHESGENPLPEPGSKQELALLINQGILTIDGSTSLIPLDGGIRAAIFGISQSEGEKQSVHSTTYGSFDNLLSNECDIIFSTPLAQNQLNNAEQKQIELEIIPMTIEGFVFIVNTKNPVSTLTQQQLKDIYSGKITNWKEVGGNDAEIIAYQRNYGSGSQRC